MDMNQGIFYLQDNNYVELPDWCYCWLQLGNVIANASSPDRRLVLALAVPTRAYIAALIGTGLVIERLKRETIMSHQEDCVAYLEMLRGVKKGTPVIIHENMKKVKGIFMGVKDNYHDGKTFVGVQVQEGNNKAGALTRWLPPERAGNIAIVEKTSASVLKLPKESKSEELVKNQIFANHFLPLGALRKVAAKSKTECEIVGQVNLLKQEVVETVFAVPRVSNLFGKEGSATRSSVNSSRLLVNGSLQDIFKIHRFCRSEETYRSKIIPNTNTAQRIVEDKESTTVLFDGALGYLKLRHLWPKSDIVLILDRTDPYFSDAINLINQEFVNRFEDADIQFVTPLGTEATSYWELR